jgi:hypothetical protein
MFTTQLWELLYAYHVIKQCTEKETTSLSNLLLTIKLNYLHDLKIMLQCLLHLITYLQVITSNLPIRKHRKCHSDIITWADIGTRH